VEVFSTRTLAHATTVHSMCDCTDQNEALPASTSEACFSPTLPALEGET
jgi:hypothetical protein